MSKTTGKILGILLSVSIIVAGICIIMQCLSIYNSGDKPYSREEVALAFSEISIPVFACIGLVIITFLYNLFFDDVYTDKLLLKNNDFIIKAISKRKNIYKLENEAIQKERRTRRIYSIVLYILLIAGFGCFFVYALNPANYHQSEINASMIKMMTAFGICIVIPFAYSVIYIFLNNKSKEREIAIIRELAKYVPANEELHKASHLNVYTFIKIFAIIVCAGIIIYGLCTGGTADVLTKAINICTECIGLG